MIDLIDLNIEIEHKPFGTKRLVEREDSPVTIAKYFSKKVQLYAGAAPIDVTSLSNGTRIAIRCCPLKPLQGHNIFGTDNVIGLGYKLISYVLSVLGIHASSKQLDNWKRGEFELEEIHITYRFSVDVHQSVGRVLAHILRNSSIKLRPTPLRKGTGIILKGVSTGTSWLLYDKLREFEDKRKHEGKYLSAVIGDGAVAVGPIYKRLRDAATNSIRSELKLDKRYLDKHGLDTGAVWNPTTVKSVYLRELKLLRLGAVPSLKFAELLLDSIVDKKLRFTFLAWMQGEDLSLYYSTQTMNTHRKAILAAVGIDIKLDRVPFKKTTVNIADIFCEANMLPNFPDWTVRHPTVAYKGQDLKIDIAECQRHRTIYTH
jgi:hypothetical protein